MSWSYPPSPDEDIQASRDATGYLFMSLKPGFYTGWWTSMQSRRKMPQPGLLNFAPPLDQAQESADGSVKMIAIRIALLVEGDEDLIRLDHPNVDEYTEADWKALLPTDEP